MKARDLMMPLQEYLTPDTTLKEAANKLRTARRNGERSGVKGLPVLDERGKMVGFLSIGDILKSIFPAYMNLADLGDFTWDGMVEDMARKAEDRKVSEMMTNHVITVDEDAPLMECVDRMIRNNIKHLPVLSKEGNVMGVLHEKEVFFAITRAMLDENAGGGK
jgi:CBS domain-containing protein